MEVVKLALPSLALVWRSYASEQERRVCGCPSYWLSSHGRCLSLSLSLGAEWHVSSLAEGLARARSSYKQDHGQELDGLGC